MLVVHSSLNGEAPTIVRLRNSGLVDVEVVERRTGPLGPLMIEQQEQGRIPDGITDEDLLVIRGRKPQS